ncbi:hypothetical protein AGMMS50212_16650 [Spirochaetia bacterium]|nr:hypothetical protein AGMMS50212_16650 [Spirochaetia bacterium]
MPQLKDTILIIDDAPEILIHINEILTGNYEVRLAKSVSAARTILETVTPDLIVLDLNMPVLNGFDFLKFLRSKANLKDIPVIVISSNAQLMNVSAATALGAKAYIVKPLNAISLRDKVHNLLLESKYGKE